MKIDPTPSLAQQAQQVRVQLQEQRMKIAAQLSAGHVVQRDFPSSMTMRLLISRPALLPRLFTLLAGPRVAAVALASFGVVRTLRADSPARARIARTPGA